MAKVIWSDLAIERIDAIVRYIEWFDPVAALRVAERLLDAGNRLSSFPNRGRPAGGGCRELSTVRPYIIRYEVVGDQVTILRIRHSAQLPDLD